MTKQEFMPEIKRLCLAFDKTLSSELIELWWEEMLGYTVDEMRIGIKHFLEIDQRSFPRIGEFKTALRGKERRFSEGTSSGPPSCPRCNHGFCSVIRWHGNQKYSYTLRCSCPSGDSYPGLPLVSRNEETVKERRRREGVKTAPRTLNLPQPLEFPSEDNEEIPF